MPIRLAKTMRFILKGLERLAFDSMEFMVIKLSLNVQGPGV